MDLVFILLEGSQLALAVALFYWLKNTVLGPKFHCFGKTRKASLWPNLTFSPMPLLRGFGRQLFGIRLRVLRKYRIVV